MNIIIQKTFDDTQKNLYAYDRWISFSSGRQKEVADKFKDIIREIPGAQLGSAEIEFDAEGAELDQDKLSGKSLRTRIEDGLLKPRLIIKKQGSIYNRTNQIGGLGDRDGVHKLDKAA